MPTMMYANKVVGNVCSSVSMCSNDRNAQKLKKKTKRLEQTKNIECLHLK